MQKQDTPDLFNGQGMALARVAAFHNKLRFHVIHVGTFIFHHAVISQQFSLWTLPFCKTLCEWHLATTFRGWNPPNRLWTRALPQDIFLK